MDDPPNRKRPVSPKGFWVLIGLSLFFTAKAELYCTFEILPIENKICAFECRDTLYLDNGERVPLYVGDLDWDFGGSHTFCIKNYCGSDWYRNMENLRASSAVIDHYYEGEGAGRIWYWYIDINPDNVEQLVLTACYYDLNVL